MIKDQRLPVKCATGMLNIEGLGEKEEELDEILCNHNTVYK